MRDKVQTMFSLVREAILEMNDNLSENYHSVNGQRATEIENKINNYRDQLRNEHTEAVKNNEYSYQTGICYSNLYAQCEKLADFAINVTEAIVKTQK